MNMLLDKFDNIQNSIVDLTNRIQEVESKIENIGTENSIAELKMKIDQHKISTSNEIKDLENKMLNYISNLKWSSVG